MKWFFGILLSALVGLVVVAKFYIPNQFHDLIHKNLLKDASSNKVYKVINSSTHQTVITTVKSVTTVTSITELNPLKDHVLFEVKDLEDPTKVIKAKITYDILNAKEVRINALFDDVSGETFSMVKPLLSFSTPLRMDLIKSKDYKIYLASNMTISFSAEKINYMVEKVSNEFSGLVATIGSKSSADPDIVSILMTFSVKELLAKDEEGKVEKFTDAKNDMTIESFKISGFKSAFAKDPNTPAAPDVPIAMKAMGLVPKIESLVTIPFKISMVTNGTHESGQMPMNFEVNIKNANIMEPNAYLVKANLSMPFNLLKNFVGDSLSVTLAQIQTKDFTHPDFVDANRPTSDIMAAMKFEQDKVANLINAFKEFFKDKTEIVVAKAVELGILKKEGNIYSTEFTFENMTMSLNGKTSFKEELAATVPQAEIDAFLISKGYISLVALANGPKKTCNALLPGFPKATNTPVTKEECVKTCESSQAFCLTSPNEKHLCYLYQCSWENELLVFKNAAPVPTERAVLTKHIGEVKEKLKALQKVR